MFIDRIARLALFACLAFSALTAPLLSGCAAMQGSQPIAVSVVGVEPLDGEGLEVRMLVKLRVQNPTESPIEFNGVSIEMNVQGKRFATGVSDASGNVPRFGEAIVAVPVSISAFHIAGQVLGVLTSQDRSKIAYEMSGKLARSTFSSVSFTASGELTLPAELSHLGQ